jgi:hypothetical protein
MEVTYSILRHKRPTAAPVNLAELAIVRSQHMPTAQVQWASLCEVERRAAEVACLHPHLQEEAAFVVADEMARRARLAAPPLTLSH